MQQFDDPETRRFSQKGRPGPNREPVPPSKPSKCAIIRAQGEKGMKHIIMTVVAAAALLGCDRQKSDIESSKDAQQKSLEEQREAMGAAAKDSKKQVEAGKEAAEAQIEAEKKKVEAQAEADKAKVDAQK
jgi:hypothetical protein